MKRSPMLTSFLLTLAIVTTGFSVSYLFLGMLVPLPDLGAQGTPQGLVPPSEQRFYAGAGTPVDVVGATRFGAAGNGVYRYHVIVHYLGGSVTPSKYAEIRNAPSPLTGSNYVRVTWAAKTGATGYTVVRSTSPNLAMNCTGCVVVSNTPSTQVDDNDETLTDLTGITLKTGANGLMQLDNSQATPKWIFIPPIDSSSLSLDVNTVVTNAVCGENTYPLKVGGVWTCQAQLHYSTNTQTLTADGQTIDTSYDHVDVNLNYPAGGGIVRTILEEGNHIGQRVNICNNSTSEHLYFLNPGLTPDSNVRDRLDRDIIRIRYRSCREFAWNRTDEGASTYEWHPIGQGDDRFEKATWGLCTTGDCAVGDNLTVPYIVQNSGTLSRCFIVAKTAPTGADLILDIYRNTVAPENSIFQSGKNLRLVAGTTSNETQNFGAVTPLIGNDHYNPTNTPGAGSTFDTLLISITQVGSTVPGRDVSVVCRYAL